jgi:hypothetical protein
MYSLLPLYKHSYKAFLWFNFFFQNIRIPRDETKLNGVGG